MYQWKAKAWAQLFKASLSLMSSLVVKMLTVLVSTLSDSQWFTLSDSQWHYLIHSDFCWKNVSSFCNANAKAIHIFFSKNISIYAIFNVQRFYNTLTNDIISFEQLGPGRNLVLVQDDVNQCKDTFSLHTAHLFYAFLYFYAFVQWQFWSLAKIYKYDLEDNCIKICHFGR